MDFVQNLRDKLRAALDERNAKQADLDAVVADATTEARDLNSAEAEKFAALKDQIVALDEQAAELRTRITEAEDMSRKADEARAEALKLGGEVADATQSRVSVTSEEMTYRQGGQHSYFKDLAKASAPGIGDSAARGRLQRHAMEMDVELRTNPNRTDGQGGEFVPPLWLINQYVKLARAGRVTADLSTKLELPDGTDTISVPKIATGATVAAQQDAGAVSNTDITTTSVSAPVNTYAGQQVISMQLLDQSPVAMDQVIFQDLLAAHAQKIGDAVLNGAGTSGAHTGILTNTGTNTITYTNSTPTGAGVYTAIAQAISNVAKTRFLPPNAVVMNPQRWYWLLSQVDSNGRPLVVPSAGTATYNGFGSGNDVVAEGSVGTIAGLPVFLDPNIGQTYSTNQDRVIVARFSDIVLYEGPIRTRVLFETDANTLQVRLQVWSYSAFTSYRYSGAISVCSGTGFAAPSGY